MSSTHVKAKRRVLSKYSCAGKAEKKMILGVPGQPGYLSERMAGPARESVSKIRWRVN